MRKFLSPRSGRPSGQSLVEFAMVASLFFLLMFGVIEMGIVVYQYTTISMAAREATRYAVAHGPNSQNPAGTGGNPTIQKVAENEAPFLTDAEITGGDAKTPFYTTDPSLPLQNDAQVTITHTYQQYIPGMSPLSITLSSTSQMLVSQ